VGKAKRAYAVDKTMRCLFCRDVANPRGHGLMAFAHPTAR
jgi:hypothetical protein